ncbi:MAG: hypothetical protein U9N45_08200, partial [Gemmatimonadota bacterium]|nr:hypothetical protein [Gemmatimonadota bacterium]
MLNKIHLFPVTALFYAILLAPPQALDAATFTVAPGDDIQGSVDSLRAGDVLLFSAGTYTCKEGLFFDNIHGT